MNYEPITAVGIDVSKGKAQSLYADRAAKWC